jgi:glycosyltransferase involved in cell wall biosynthesis
VVHAVPGWRRAGSSLLRDVTMLISAIMPTRGRQAYAIDAVSCFRCQTYPHKELIILDDADDPSFPVPPDIPGIQYHRLAKRLTIGAKRNICCSRAEGEVIAHWDSDDYSAPERLEDQFQRLLSTGADVTGYNAMRFTDGARWWQYTGSEDYALGTSLMYRREYWEANPFPCEMVGEDSAFIVPARKAQKIACVDAGDLMTATIHAGNTSPRVIPEGSKQWREIF